MSAKLGKISRHYLSSFPENIHKLSSKTLQEDNKNILIISENST